MNNNLILEGNRVYVVWDRDTFFSVGHDPSEEPYKITNIVKVTKDVCLACIGHTHQAEIKTSKGSQLVSLAWFQKLKIFPVEHTVECQQRTSEYFNEFLKFDLDNDY